MNIWPKQIAVHRKIGTFTRLSSVFLWAPRRFFGIRHSGRWGRGQFLGSADLWLWWEERYFSWYFIPLSLPSHFRTFSTVSSAAVPPSFLSEDNQSHSSSPVPFQISTSLEDSLKSLSRDGRETRTEILNLFFYDLSSYRNHCLSLRSLVPPRCFFVFTRLFHLSIPPSQRRRPAFMVTYKCDVVPSIGKAKTRN